MTGLAHALFGTGNLNMYVPVAAVPQAAVAGASPTIDDLPKVMACMGRCANNMSEAEKTTSLDSQQLLRMTKSQRDGFLKASRRHFKS